MAGARYGECPEAFFNNSLTTGDRLLFIRLPTLLASPSEVATVPLACAPETGAQRARTA